MSEVVIEVPRRDWSWRWRCTACQKCDYFMTRGMAEREGKRHAQECKVEVPQKKVQANDQNRVSG